MRHGLCDALETRFEPPISKRSDVAPPGKWMRVISSWMFLVVVLALSLAMPPMAANAHCLGAPENPVASAMSHDHAAMNRDRDHSGHDKQDRKATDCLLRCLAACAGVVATGPSQPLALTMVADRHRLPPQLVLEGLPARPLLPPPQLAFI